MDLEIFRCVVWTWSYLASFHHDVCVSVTYPLCFGKCSNLPTCFNNCWFIPPVKLKWINWIRLYTLKYSLRTLCAFVTPSYRPQSTFYRLCPVKRLTANLTGIHYMSAVDIFLFASRAGLTRPPASNWAHENGRWSLSSVEVIFILYGQFYV
jgi:hypothetical protein